MSFNWTCDFCNTVQTVVDQKCNTNRMQLYCGKSKYSHAHFLEANIICCSNPNCEEVTSSVHLYAKDQNFERVHRISEYRNEYDTSLIDTLILPRGAYKIQPSYIPNVLTEDYYEACQILQLSPKASATLTRRCLQGMIRDFCKISKGTLYKEIEELKKAYQEDSAPKGVTDETVEAIDHVRTIGNIGAHMEKDIDKIIDIDPGEAEALIGLVELLFEEWYVARYKREQKLEKIKAIKLDKEEQKKAPAAAPAQPKTES